jgi:hypothetical protein
MSFGGGSTVAGSAMTKVKSAKASGRRTIRFMIA